jgi:hypothetical protein
MTNTLDPAQTMTLALVPGDGPASWIGRSPRTRGVVMVTQGQGTEMAVAVHNDIEASLSMTIRLDCLQLLPPAPSK